MSDQSVYVNAYIENITAMVHDQLNQIIQLRTQLKVSESALAQKDAHIAELKTSLVSLQNNENEMNGLREKVRIAEDSYHALINKVSHMETLQNQFNDIKNKFKQKESELTKEKAKVETLENELKMAKEAINSSKVQEEIVIEPLTKKKINKKKESATLEFPAEVAAESNDF